MSLSRPTEPTAAPPRGRNRRWIWFFAVLAALGAAAVVIPVVYNLRQQLRPEQLAEARERWRQFGTGDYDLAFEVRYDTDPRPDEHQAQVRGGEVVSWVINGEKQIHTPGARPLENPAGSDDATLEVWRRPDVEGIFNMIEKWLQEDATSTGRRNFATASFDPRDGHPFHYVHRVAGTGQRQEWNIKLTRVTASP